MTQPLTSPIHFHYQGDLHCLDLQGVSEDKTVVQNLCKLFARSRGTQLRVNTEGLLVEMTWKDWFSFTWNKGEEDQKLQDVIYRALHSLNTFISRQANREVHNLAIKYLFDKNGERGIGRLSKALYNPLWVQSHNALSKASLPEHTIRIRLGNRFIDYTSDKIDTNPEQPFLSIDLEDKLAEKNLWKLLVRKPGQKYQMGCAEGRSKEEINQEMQKTVTDVITRLNASLMRQKTVTHVHQLAIQMIFSKTGPLCRMNKEVFNRGAITEGSCIEAILTPSFAEKRGKLAIAMQNLRDGHEDKTFKKAVEAAFMDLVYAELLFVQKLGMDLEPNGDGGSGGARYARDRYGRKMLVVKPGDEGPNGVNNPQWYARFKRWVVSPKACLEGNSEPLAEMDSWACDRHFDIWSVPPTEMRYVESADFVGDSVKKCSLQMFVEGCSTLGEYVDVAPSLHGMSRPFLRWYCGSQQQTGFFSSFEPRTERATELLSKLPHHSLERVALHNFLIEDVDCHFENILVKLAEPTPENTVLSRVFRGDASASDEDIQGFVAGMFAQKGNQVLLDQLLFSETVMIDGKPKKVTLVKHDGGSSNPHNHSSAWDYLSIRFKYLFEALPHFEQPYSETVKPLFTNKEENLHQFLREKARSEVYNILEGTRDVNGVTTLVSKIFWEDQKNQETLNEFIFTKDPDRSYHLRLELIAALVIASGATAVEGPAYQFYFNYHLRRIHGNIQSRLDSYEVLTKHLQNPQEPMRTLFKDVRSYEDFMRELPPDPTNK